MYYLPAWKNHNSWTQCRISLINQPLPLTGHCNKMCQVYWIGHPYEIPWSSFYLHYICVSNLSNNDFCNPYLYSDKIAASSVNKSKCIEISFSVRHEPISFCRWSSMSFRNREKQIGDVISPWNKPRLLAQKSEIEPKCLIHIFTSLYIDLNDDNIYGKPMVQCGVLDKPVLYVFL